jgi:predicted DNA-binding protein with PD1-like motif
MHPIIRSPHLHLVRLEKGEELLHALTAYSRDHGCGSFTAIGASSRATLSFFDPLTKQYHPTTFTEDMEIVSLTGNIAHGDGEIIVHAHAALGRRDLNVIGGHVQELVIGPTCEVSFMPYGNNDVRRAFDETTGLRLLV